jgi:hypothetical protein
LTRMSTTSPSSRTSTLVERRVCPDLSHDFQRHTFLASGAHVKFSLTMFFLLSPDPCRRQGRQQAVLEVPQREHSQEIQEATAGRFARHQG